MEIEKKSALWAYAYWAGINLVVFSLLFPLADALAEWRGGSWKIYFDFELRIPLLEQFKIFFATFGGHDLTLTVEIEMSVITDTRAYFKNAPSA